MNRALASDIFVFCGLISLAAGSRLIGAEPNFAAVSACALFAGFYFRRLLVAIAVPVVAMLVSDVVHGFYDPRQMLIVYACLALPILLRRVLGHRPSAVRVLSCSLLSATAFFLFTNFAVWVFSPLYAKSVDGFSLCYINALPFFRMTLMSDVLFAAGLFGLHALLSRRNTRVLKPVAA